MKTRIALQNELHTMLMKREKRKKEINCNGLLLFVVVFAHRNAITCNTMFCEHVKHRNVTLWLMPKKFQCKHFHTKLFLLHDEFTMECSFSHSLSQYWMVMARRSDLTLTALAPPFNLNLSVRPLNVIVSGFFELNVLVQLRNYQFYNRKFSFVWWVEYFDKNSTLIKQR